MTSRGWYSSAWAATSRISGSCSFFKPGAVRAEPAGGHRSTQAQQRAISGFFSPHVDFPCRVRVKATIGEAVLRELHDRGHEVDVAPAWSEGFLLAAERDMTSGVIEAGCDPRGVKAQVFSPAARCW